MVVNFAHLKAHTLDSQDLLPKDTLNIIDALTLERLGMRFCQ